METVICYLSRLEMMSLTCPRDNLGLFNFRSFLNIGMLLAESEKAKALRSTILERNKGTVPPFLKEKGEKMCIFRATPPLLVLL